MLLRRQIEKELRSKPDCRSVYKEMYPYYLLTFTMPLYSLYILRKELLVIKCLAFSGIFSISYINIKLRLERDMFYRRGFTQTPTGKVIRSIYIDRKPQSVAAEAYKEYDRKLQTLLGKYYPRENPLERFREYEIAKQ